MLPPTHGVIRVGGRSHPTLEPLDGRLLRHHCYQIPTSAQLKRFTGRIHIYAKGERWNHVSNAIVDAVKEQWTNIEALVLDTANLQDEANLEPLLNIFRNIKMLRHLSLRESKLASSGVPLLIDSLVDSNQEEATLRSPIEALDVAGNMIWSNDIGCLTSLFKPASDTLVKLVLASNPIGADGHKILAGSLGHLKNLEHLDISSTYAGERGTTYILESLFSLDRLQTLKLRDNTIPGEVSVMLNTPFERIVSPGVACGVHWVSCALAFVIETNLWKSISTLDLGQNPMCAQGMHIFSKGLIECNIVTLTDLNLNNNKINFVGAAHLSEALSRVGNGMIRLSLAKNMISSEGIAALAKPLQNMRNLEQLFLAENGITESGGMELGSSLMHLHKLTSFSIGRNPIKNEGTMAIIAGLQSSSSSLEDLDMSICHFDGPNLAYPISKSMANMEKLKHLNMEGNAMTVQGLSHITSALIPVRSNLITLNLGGVHMYAEGAQLLSGVLTQFKCLKDLGIGYNKLGDHGLKFILPALQKCISISYLGLQHNNFGPTSIFPLADFILNSPNLIQVLLYGNNIHYGPTGLTPLASCRHKVTWDTDV
eukprot:756415-Hanusia_phi.AAC.4